MTLIAGRYRLEGRLGLGGMSTVHLAVDERLGRQVAVKLLAEHLATDPTFVNRFQREALAAARLVHPNVVQVFDSGLDERSGQHFIVMEHVPGPSVAELLRDEGRLEVGEAVDLVVQACRGLDYAHRHGVVHRDVKPGNLLRTPDGTVKLADFGIAKATEQSSITQVGSVLGTAAYLAPEQARGEEAGPPSDLYSLGVVAYQVLAGRLPYEAASLSELVLKQQQEPPPRLDGLRPEVPPALAVAVGKALAIDPAARYATAPEMAAAVDQGERGHLAAGLEPDATAATSVLSSTAATRAVPAAPLAAPATAQHRRPRPAPADGPGRYEPRDGRGAEPQRRGTGRGRRVLAVLLILLLVGAGVGVAVWSSMSQEDRVELRDVVQRDVDEAINAMEDLVRENTR